MRILIAPAPYKECLDARSVADCLEEGVLAIFPDAQITKLPICDGGTGLVDRLVDALGGTIVSCRAHDPLMRLREGCKIGLLPEGTAVIESAAAAGLALLKRDERNPLLTTTYGVGDLIHEAVNRGYTKIIIGCGDSATNDGGAGMAQALGIKLLDVSGQQIQPGGAALLDLNRIDISDMRLPAIDVTVACNITSLLCGEDGTTHKYSRQKGATPEMEDHLARAMERYADVLEKYLGWDIRYLPGTGAAGGLGAALFAFLGAKIRYSMDLVSKALHLEDYVSRADLVVTGEGTLDGGSATGKAACAIGLIAKKYNVPTVAIAGAIGHNADIVFFHGIDLAESTVKEPVTLEEALKPEAARFRITDATIRIMRSIRRGALILGDR